MKKSLIILGATLLFGVGAADPFLSKPHDQSDVYGGVQLAYGGDEGAMPGPVYYRPCRSRSDDHCIQLYEHGVRRSYARWLVAHGESPTWRPLPPRRYAVREWRRGPSCHVRMERVAFSAGARKPLFRNAPPPDRVTFTPMRRHSEEVSTPGI